MTNKSSGTLSLSAQTVVNFQWVYGPIVAVEIPASAATIRIRGRAGIYSDLYSARMSIRFVRPNGTLRSRILSCDTALDGTLWGTSNTNYSSTPTCSNVSCNDGDYLVIEAGANQVASSAADSEIVVIGDTDASNYMYVTLPATIQLGVAPTSLTYDFTSVTLLRDQPAGKNTPTVDGIPAPTFTKESGDIPTGMSLNATTGIISGTPTANGTYSFVVTATNMVGHVHSATLTYTVKVLGGGQTMLCNTMR